MLICILLCTTIAWLGYRVDTGPMTEQAMLPYIAVLVVVLLLSLVLTIRYMNKYAKHRD